MHNDLEEMISSVFINIIETMAFMFGEVVAKDDLPESADDYFLASMGFSGERSGTVSLVVPSEMCDEISANILGLDPGDERVRSNPCDALNEVLNVTCGRILTELAGTAPIFDLTVPELKKLDRAGYESVLEETGIICFIVDEYPVILMFESSTD